VIKGQTDLGTGVVPPDRIGGLLMIYFPVCPS